MGNLLQQGPSREEKRSARITEFNRMIEQLPIKERTPSRLIDLAAQVGAKHPELLVEDFYKKHKEFRTMLKESLPEPGTVPTGTVPVTSQVLELLKQAQLPTTGLEQPIPLPAPLGMNLETGRPLQIQELLEMVPGLANASLPGPIVRNQPELSLFGPQAIAGLPQEPVPGAFTPSPLITEAASRVGALPKPEPIPSVGGDREAIAGELFKVARFSDLNQNEKAIVNNRVQNDQIKQRAAQGAAGEQAKLNFSLNQQRSQTQRVIEGLTSVQDKIMADPAILGAPGKVSNLITSVSDQAKAFVNLIVPGAFDEFLKIEKHANIFREAGIENAKLKSQLLGLSIALALAEGFQDRGITDRKIELNLKRLTGAAGSGSAEIAFSTLEQLKQEMIAGFNTQAQASSDILSAAKQLPAQPERRFSPSGKRFKDFEVIGREPAP